MTLTGKVLVTGGSGYLARGIYRKAEREGWPAEFTAYARHEDGLTRLKRRFPHVRGVVGDVRDTDLLAATIAGHDVVVHAGALKRVPEAESNVFETVSVNVEGSRSVAIAAARAGARAVVGISTDKACSPQTTYGMTKAMMERMFSEAARLWPATNYQLVRYGNVVSSTGSVVPLFRQQAQDWGELRITDERMTRFWLSVDDAVDLIACAASWVDPGVIHVPRCAAMRVIDLARTVAPECPVRYVGLRPAEKLHEELLAASEVPRARTISRGPRDGYVVFPPTATGIIEGLATSPYSSDAPARWLPGDEMRAMIEDAEDLERA